MNIDVGIPGRIARIDGWVRQRSGYQRSGQLVARDVARSRTTIEVVDTRPSDKIVIIPAVKDDEIIDAAIAVVKAVTILVSINRVIRIGPGYPPSSGGG